MWSPESLKTTDRLLAAVPVRSFDHGLARLAGALGAGARRRLGMALAVHTVECLAEAGVAPAVVAGDAEVAEWAQGVGVPVIMEPAGRGLDGAAAAGAAAAEDEYWAVFHSDLPLLTIEDVAVFVTRLRISGVALAPAADAGTTVYGGSGPPPRFSYGPGSFHRHLQGAPQAAVVCRPGLALDLDTVVDLDTALRLPGGKWLSKVVDP